MHTFALLTVVKEHNANSEWRSTDMGIGGLVCLLSVSLQYFLILSAIIRETERFCIFFAHVPWNRSFLFTNPCSEVKKMRYYPIMFDMFFLSLTAVETLSILGVVWVVGGGMKGWGGGGYFCQKICLSSKVESTLKGMNFLPFGALNTFYFRVSENTLCAELQTWSHNNLQPFKNGGKPRKLSRLFNRMTVWQASVSTTSPFSVCFLWFLLLWLHFTTEPSALFPPKVCDHMRFIDEIEDPYAVLSHIYISELRQIWGRCFSQIN